MTILELRIKDILSLKISDKDKLVIIKELLGGEK
jgi:hypothetical protein